MPTPPPPPPLPGGAARAGGGAAGRSRDRSDIGGEQPLPASEDVIGRCQNQVMPTPLPPPVPGSAAGSGVAGPSLFTLRAQNAHLDALEALQAEQARAYAHQVTTLLAWFDLVVLDQGTCTDLAALELAPVLRSGQHHAGRLLRDALHLRDRLPALRTALTAGTLWQPQARVPRRHRTAHHPATTTHPTGNPPHQHQESPAGNRRARTASPHRPRRPRRPGPDHRPLLHRRTPHGRHRHRRRRPRRRTTRLTGAPAHVRRGAHPARPRPGMIQG